LRHTIARNAADGGYTKKFVARNVAEVGRDSTAAILRAILRATNFGVDTRCNSAIPHNIAPAESRSTSATLRATNFFVYPPSAAFHAIV